MNAPLGWTARSKLKPPKLRLKAGALYVTRSGRQAYVVALNGSCFWGVIKRETAASYRWTLDGRTIYTGADDDIVGLWVEKKGKKK
jgi:L-ascorbate metabolism protein UlaG (beta-lactamase superfamily)